MLFVVVHACSILPFLFQLSSLSPPDEDVEIGVPRHIKPPPPLILALKPLNCIMQALPPIPTHPVELSTLKKMAHRLVDTVSNLTRHGQFSHTEFRARVDVDRPARDNKWDDFVDITLRRLLADDSLLMSAPNVQQLFAAGKVLFGDAILRRPLHKF